MVSRTGDCVRNDGSKTMGSENSVSLDFRQGTFSSERFTFPSGWRIPRHVYDYASRVKEEKIGCGVARRGGGGAAERVLPFTFREGIRLRQRRERQRASFTSACIGRCSPAEEVITYPYSRRIRMRIHREPANGMVFKNQPLDQGTLRNIAWNKEGEAYIMILANGPDSRSS